MTSERHFNGGPTLLQTPEPEPSDTATTPDSGESPDQSRKLILVVDDDVNVRESLRDVLVQENFAVKLAGDGREAVHQFLDGPPDLVLLDVNMPDLTGWQAFQIMAQLYPFVPVMIITARPGQARHAADMGINALLEKPLDIPVLLRLVRELIARPDSAHFAEVVRCWPTSDHFGSQG